MTDTNFVFVTSLGISHSSLRELHLDHIYDLKVWPCYASCAVVYIFCGVLFKVNIWQLAKSMCYSVSCAIFGFHSNFCCGDSVTLSICLQDLYDWISTSGL